PDAAATSWRNASGSASGGCSRPEARCSPRQSWRSTAASSRSRWSRPTTCSSPASRRSSMARSARRSPITSAPTSDFDRNPLFLKKFRNDDVFRFAGGAPMLRSMGLAQNLPLFHLYGDPPDDQAFDFIHIETIASRSSVHDWTIRAHRHRNLFQILAIEHGGGEMTYEASTIAFTAPSAILVAPTTAHGFRFMPAQTDGWVVSFTEDVAQALGEGSGEAFMRLKALAAEPVVPLASEAEIKPLLTRCSELHEESFLARDGF